MTAPNSTPPIVHRQRTVQQPQNYQPNPNIVFVANYLSGRIPLTPQNYQRAESIIMRESDFE
jgi:hypothetical protein